MFQTYGIKVGIISKKNSRGCLAEYDISCTKERTARAALLFFLIQPIKSLIGSVVLPSSFLKVHMTRNFLLAYSKELSK